MTLISVVPEAERVVGLATTTKVVVVVEYHGANYYGFQLQTGLPTIQGEMEKALEKLTGERIRVVAASRTDSGVHAKGQVASFRTRSLHPLAAFVSGLNYYLPRDIAVKAAFKVSDSFSVRRQAVSREYHYYILNSPIRSPLWEGLAYFVPAQLDIDVINQACQAIVGEHDFASFASEIGVTKRNTVRRADRAEVRREGELVIFDFVASSFLPHQVRNTVGSLLKVGVGKMSVAGFAHLLESRKPGSAGPTAPACGLYLVQVNYPYPLGEEISRYDENL